MTVFGSIINSIKAFASKKDNQIVDIDKLDREARKELAYIQGQDKVNELVKRLLVDKEKNSLKASYKVSSNDIKNKIKTQTQNKEISEEEIVKQ